MSKQIEQARRGLSASELGHVDTAAPERAPGYVLLPGDPNRVEKMAAQWDEGAKLYTLSRRSAAAVGTYKGVELGAWSTGIGGPSAECTLTDLAARGTHTFIRVGTTGAIQEGIRIGDIIINKIDTVKKEELLPAIDTYRKICDFAEIIPCSALRGKNTQDIIPSIFKYLPYGPMFYDEDTVTDQPQRQIAAEIIREKALHALDEEIPHGIAVAIDRMKKRPGRSNIIDIDATIICERNSHKGIIIGKQGAMLKKIGSNARYELERMLEAKVNLKLWVKVTKNWRDSDFLIKNFGYDKKEI